MELKNRTLSNFAELVETGECKKFRGRLKTGIDLGTANTVLAVVDRNNRPIAGISAPSHAIQDGVIVNYYESVQLVTKLKMSWRKGLAQNLFTVLLPSLQEFLRAVSKASAMFWRVPVSRLQISWTSLLPQLLSLRSQTVLLWMWVAAQPVSAS